MTSNPTNTQEDELDENFKGSFPFKAVRSGGKLYTEEQLAALISNQREQARQELLDELEVEIQEIATSKPSVAYATSIPTNKVLYSIAAKRATLPKKDEQHDLS